MPKPAVANTPSKLSVDFTGVEDKRGGTRSDHVPPGDYLLKVVGCEKKAKKDSKPKTFYLSWLLEVVSPGKYKGKHLYHVTSLKQESLWSLRNFLVDLLGEKKVPKGALDIPLAAIVAKQVEIGATLEDDEYQKDGAEKVTLKSVISATFPKKDFSEAAGDDEDEEESEDEEEEEELDTDDDDL